MCIYFYNKNVVVYKVTKPARAIDILTWLLLLTTKTNKHYI